jgi:guanylate cyclase soluble subunit beta
MYGLINRSLKNMIQEKFGDYQWGEILQASGVPEDSFLTSRPYDDSLTYDLVGAASEVLDASPETCLEMFGEYWVLSVAAKDYAALMDVTGTDMVTFISNLNSLHDRITSSFLDYVPPEFRLESLGDDSYRMDYISSRLGLSHFVLGLLRGLAIHFNCQIEFLSIKPETVESGSHVVFTFRQTAREG